MTERAENDRDRSLRDARLLRALAHAPDAQAQPDPAVRHAVLAAARAAVAAPVARTDERRGADGEHAGPETARGRAGWRRWRHSIGAAGSGAGAGRPWNAAFATLLVAGVVVLIWQGQPTPDARPERVASVDRAAPRVAEPAAKRSENGSADAVGASGANAPSPAPAPAPSPSPSPPAQRPVDRAPPAAEPAAPAAPATAPSERRELARARSVPSVPPPLAAPPAESPAQESLQAGAGSARAARESALADAAPARAAAPSAMAPLTVWPPAWTQARTASGALRTRAQTDRLPDLLRALQTADAQAASPAAADASGVLRLELLRDERVLGVLEVGADSWRYLPREAGARGAGGMLDAPTAAALRAALQALDAPAPAR